MTVQSWHADTPVHRGVLSTVIAASVVEISHRLRKVKSVDPETLVSAFDCTTFYFLLAAHFHVFPSIF